MGVWGLQTFLENHESDGCCYNANIGELANKYRSEKDGYAKIVIDAQSCMRNWLSDLKNPSSGYQMAELSRVLTKFVNAFKQLEIGLIFYFGGTTVEKKRPLWIRRRKISMQKLEEIFNQIRSHAKLDTINSSDVIFPNMSLFAMLILEHILDCEVYVSVQEADEEIMMFAHDRKCFAILAQDSDFVISQGEYYYFSSNHLNLNNMTTKVYDGKRLASFLGIKQNELPLLASLVGNDLIDRNLLKKFHDKISKYGKYSKVENVAAYIKQLPSSQFDSDLSEIALDVFKNGQSCELLNLSMKSYTLSAIKPMSVFEKYMADRGITRREEISKKDDNWLRIKEIALKNHESMYHASSIWSVINDSLYESNPAMEVYDDEDLEPSGITVKPLRQRFYGILLYEKPPTGKPPLVTEWVVYSNKIQPSTVPPILPKANHPGLINLWRGPDKDFRRHRWNLFLEAILGYVPCDISVWEKLPARLVLPTASIGYLRGTGTLRDFEIYALMATIAKCYNVFPNSPENSEPMYPEIRAIHIVTMIMRTFVLCYSLLGSCGYPVPRDKEISVFPFDGPLFQSNYKRSRKCSPDSSISDESDREILCKMEEIIFKQFECSRKKKSYPPSERTKLTEAEESNDGTFRRSADVRQSSSSALSSYGNRYIGQNYRSRSRRNRRNAQYNYSNIINEHFRRHVQTARPNYNRRRPVPYQREQYQYTRY